MAVSRAAALSRPVVWNDPRMNMLKRLQRWWQGDAGPAARAEAARLRDERQTIKASVPGPNYYDGLHQREKDDRSH